MRPKHRSGFGRNMVVLTFVLALLVSACESADDSTGATTTSIFSTTADWEALYSIVEDASYLNVKIGSTEPVKAYDDPELGDWFYASGPIGVQGPVAGFIMYRRYTDAGREDLAVLLADGAVDAIRLTGETSDVYLGLSCDDGVVVLTSDGVPMDSTQHDLETATRAWRAGPDGVIEEFDPATGDSMGSC